MFLKDTVRIALALSVSARLPQQHIHSNALDILQRILFSFLQYRAKQLKTIMFSQNPKPIKSVLKAGGLLFFQGSEGALSKTKCVVNKCIDHTY